MENIIRIEEEGNIILPEEIIQHMNLTPGEDLVSINYDSNNPEELIIKKDYQHVALSTEVIEELRKIDDRPLEIVIEEIVTKYCKKERYI